MKALAKWILRKEIREYERRIASYAKWNKWQGKLIRDIRKAAGVRWH